MNKHCWRFETHWRKEPEPDPIVRDTDPRIRMRIPPVPKCHGSGTLFRIEQIVLDLYWHLLPVCRYQIPSLFLTILIIALFYTEGIVLYRRKFWP
jgi:hypothetical protein